MRNTNYVEITEDQFKIIGTSLLHGYRRNDAKIVVDAGNPPIAVIGATSASAEAHIRSILGDRPASFTCYGSDTSPRALEPKNVTVLDVIIVLPEVRYVSDNAMQRIARQIERLNRRKSAVVFFVGETMSPYYEAYYKLWLQESAPFNTYNAHNTLGPQPVDPLYITREHVSRYTQVRGHYWRQWAHITAENICFGAELEYLSGEVLSTMMYTLMSENSGVRRWATDAIARKVFEHREWLHECYDEAEDRIAAGEIPDPRERLHLPDKDGYTISDDQGPVPVTFYDKNGNDQTAQRFRKPPRTKPVLKKK